MIPDVPVSVLKLYLTVAIRGEQRMTRRALQTELCISRAEKHTRSRRNPPDLMGKATRPSYLINNDRMSYGYSDTIKITTLRVSAANMSLMGAMSSTPGNSTGSADVLPSIQLQRLHVYHFDAAGCTRVSAGMAYALRA
jgi:hypothetical protein